LAIVGAVATTLAGDEKIAPASATRDARRISEAVRRIAAHPDERLALAGLAHDAAMSPYHFLRVFRRIVGMTPYQYVLLTRLRRAAIALRRSTLPITAIALDAGFDDLSTFNRRFRRVMGVTPGAYRAGAGC